NAPAPARACTLSLHDALPISNAVEHACTGVWLTLERGPHGLRVSVRDGSPVGFPGPVQRSTDPLGRVRGRGLELVENLTTAWGRSEEHTSELQSRSDLVCRPL